MSLGANRHYRLTDEANAKSAWKDLGGGLIALRGFFMSVRLATGRVLLNLQPKASANIEHGPLLDVAVRFAAGGSGSTQKLAKFLEKVKIEVNPPPDQEEQVISTHTTHQDNLRFGNHERWVQGGSR